MTLGYDSGIFSQELNELTELDDTKINNKTVTDGQVLAYNATSKSWVNQTSTGGIPSYATRPVAPTTGLVIYNSTKGNIELYNGIFWVEVSPNSFIFNIEYLVIAGGGSGGRSVTPQRGVGGGGAGGYRTNYATETSGGGGSTESAKSITAGVSYSVTIGVGGASKTTDGQGNNGLDSVFDNITAVGGGGGGANSGGVAGGSGGGGVKDPVTGGAGTANQGYAGGTGFDGGASPFAGGGGGGAGALGGNANSGNGGNGGAGVESSITGTPTYRGGGGGGGRTNTTSYTNFGSGGIGGGGGGSAGVAGTDGTGGGGGGAGSGNSGKGGDGIVILRYPDTFTISQSGGLTISSETSAGGYKHVEITAGTGTISFG